MPELGAVAILGLGFWVCSCWAQVCVSFVRDKEVFAEGFGSGSGERIRVCRVVGVFVTEGLEEVGGGLCAYSGVRGRAEEVVETEAIDGRGSGEE